MRPKSFWSRNWIHIVSSVYSSQYLSWIEGEIRKYLMKSIGHKKDLRKVMYSCANNMVMLVVHEEPQIKQHALMNIECTAKVYGFLSWWMYMYVVM